MHNNVEQFDAAISAVLSGQLPKSPEADEYVRELLETASDLRFLARPEFRARLLGDLIAQASLPAARRRVFDANFPARSQLRPRAGGESVLPPVFSTGTSTLPVRGFHLAMSFALHIAALAVVFSSGWWKVKNSPRVRTQLASRFSETIDYILPAAPGETHGGGGGGNHDKLPALARHRTSLRQRTTHPTDCRCDQRISEALRRAYRHRASASQTSATRPDG